jgi:hypothetical protein
MKTSKLIGIRSLVLGAAMAAAISSSLIAKPAYAGSWVLSGTPTGGILANWGNTPVSPTYTSSSMSFDVSSGTGGVNCFITGNVSYTGTVTWVGSGTAPAYATITEYSYAQGTYDNGTGSASANDGLGDGSTTTTYYDRGGIHYRTASGSKTTTTHVYTVTIGSGGHYTFTRNITDAATSNTVTCDGELYYNVSVK